MGQASNIDGFGDELWYKCGVAMLVKVATVWVMVKIMTVVVMNYESEKMLEAILIEWKY